MEQLSKQEVAHNVLDYYQHNKEKLQLGLENYSEAQGKGFICWRFLMNPVSTSRASSANDLEAMAISTASGGAANGLGASA